MKILFLLASLAVSTQISAQNRFVLTDASKTIDIAIDVGSCSQQNFGLCGPVKVNLYRKKSQKHFQTLRLSQTQMWDAKPKANVTRLYDDQSIINVDDFNFDGVEDLAICDGDLGGYRMPSYRIYLYSKSLKRFVYSRSFTRMNRGGLGMFKVDKRKRMHFVYTKSGCCWHQTQGFDVFRGRPRMVYELTEDATIFNSDGTREVHITTRKFIRSRWRSWMKRFKVPDDDR